MRSWLAGEAPASAGCTRVLVYGGEEHAEHYPPGQAGWITGFLCRPSLNSAFHSPEYLACGPMLEAGRSAGGAFAMGPQQALTMAALLGAGAGSAEGVELFAAVGSGLASRNTAPKSR